MYFKMFHVEHSAYFSVCPGVFNICANNHKNYIFYDANIVAENAKIVVDCIRGVML